MQLSERLPTRGNVDRRTEMNLPCEPDPRRNYSAEIDQLCPPWGPDIYKEHETLEPGCAYSDNSGPRLVVDHRAMREYSLPHFRYVRALNPAGSVVPLIVSTVRPTPEFANGEDGLGTEHRVIGEKQKKGWLVLEPNAAEMGYAGRSGDEYYAWVMAVRDYRMQVNQYHEDQDKQDYQSKMLSAMKEQGKVQAEQTSTMVAQIAGAIGQSVANAMVQAQADAAQPRRKGSKAEE